MSATTTAHEAGVSVSERAKWTTAYVNDLPDSAFLYVEDGGEKDDEGKTKPRTLRHFPYKDANGDVDLPHLRNALARIPQSNLPADVKEKLTKKAQALLAEHGGDSDDGRSRQSEIALRYAVAPLTHVEVRDPSANPDNTWTFSGYAAVFNRATVLYDGNFLRVTEEIDERFFDDIFREQPMLQPEGVVHFNYGHDMLSSVAATDVPPNQPGWLKLTPDAHGLGFHAKASRDDPDAVRMAVKMRDKVLRQASFAFTIAEKETQTRDLGDGRIEEHDRLLRGGRLYDVCATPQGAYSQTVSQLRSYAAAIGQSSLRELEAISVIPSGGASTVSAERDGRVAKPRLTAEQLQKVAKHRLR